MAIFRVLEYENVVFFIVWLYYTRLSFLVFIGECYSCAFSYTT